MRNSCATEADWNNALWKYDKLMKDMPYDIEKIGVMYANVLPNRWADKVIIGYSLCNRKYDKWDHIQTRYRRGFGLHIAFARACKWMEIEDDAERSMKYTTLSDEVPNSIRKPLKAFIERCSKYYQDKDLPYWAKDLCGWVSILEAVENTAGLKK
jgi:hypothetical protein